MLSHFRRGSFSSQKKTRGTSTRAALKLEQLEARENPAPIATVSGLSNATPFLGDNVNYSFTFANTDATDTGFSPFFDLIVETSGPDGTTNLPPASLNPTSPANAADGFVGLSGATVPNVVVSGLALTPVGTPVVLTAGQTTYVNPFTGQTLSVPAGYGAGDTIYTYQLPFGSFTPGQNTQVSVQLPTSRLADLGTPLDLTVRPGFRDTDGNPNAPLVPTAPGAHLDSSATATPKLYDLIKTYVGPEDETATGPNYVRRYRLSVDIATGQTINGLQLTDDLGATMQLAGINATNMAAFRASSGLGNNVFSTANLSGTATATAPDGTVIYNFGNVTGVAGVDAVFEFDFFVPRDNSAGSEILPQPTPPAPNPTGGTNSTTDTNTASSAGTWNPLDSRDPQNQNVAKTAPDNGPHTLQEHSVAVQKTVDIVTIANPNTPTGGGVVPGQSLLRYTINFQVSDYYAVNDLFLEDVLGDGQRLYLASGFTPTLTVQNPYTFANGGERAATSTGTFGGANTIDFERRYSILGDTDSDPSAGVEGYAATGPTGGPFSAATTNLDGTGSTFLRFNISDELIDRGLPGVLVGGEIADGGGNPQNLRTPPFGAAQGTITFWAIAKREYSDNFPSGDPSVDQGDVLTNSVPLIQGSHLDTNDLSDGAPTQLGTVGTDNSGTSVTIANGVQTKTVFAINNTIIPTQTVADTVFSVQAGDRITYKLTYTLPISRFEDLVILDIPPLPVMQVGPAAQYTFDRTNDNSFNPYEIEVAPDDTFFSTFGAFPTPTITTDPLTNTLSIDFGNFDDPQARATTISLLVTFPVGGDSFVGDLFLTNQLRVNEGNTFLGTTTVEDLRRIQLVRPIVTIDKGIVGFGDTGRTLGGIAFTAPNDPPTGASTPSFTGVVDTAAEADAIGSANLLAADGADAGDRVRYAIVAQNTGRGDAYDVVIEDRVQPGYNIPGTFAGLNLNVRRGDGTLLSNFAEVDAFARVATTGSVGGTFSTTGGGQFTNVNRTLDTVVLNVNDLVLVKDQATASQNGVYRVTAVDLATNTVTLTRDAAFDTAGELSNSLVAIMGGTSANRYFEAGAVATLNASAVSYTLQATTEDYYAIYDSTTGAFRLLLSDNYTAGNQNFTGGVPDDRAGSLSRRESTPLVNAGDNPPVTLITNGSNTVVVQYDLILADNVTPNQSIVNTAEVTNLGTSEGGEDTTDPTLVTGATPITDTATAIVQVPTQTKTLIGTEITQPGNNTANQATIGELVTYEVVLTIPEGTTPGANLFDQLDEGLAFNSIESVTLSSTAISTSTGLTFANNGATNATTLGGGGNTTFTGSNLKNITFNLGDITNTNRDNATDETITIRYRVVVLNTNSLPGDADGNQAGDQRNNSARLRWTNNNTTLGLVSAANVTIVEPQITTTKDVAVQPAGTGAYSAFTQTVRADAGDNIRYRVTLANGAPSGSTTAFDVTLSDPLPTANFVNGVAAFSIFSVTQTGTGQVRRDGATHTLTSADFEITAGGTLRLNQAFRYDIEPNVSVEIVVEGLNFRGATGQLVNNVADVRWSSLEQDPGNRAGNGATNGVQRTGADGEGNGLNNYADADNAVIESPPIVRKTLVTTSETSTSGANTAVGEIARFRLVASVPEGTTRNFQIQDVLPNGLAFLNDGTARFAFVSTGGNVLSSTGVTNVTGLGTPAIGTGGVDGNETTIGALLSANIIGTFNDDNVSGASAGAGTGEATVYANGADVFFRFGDLANTDNDTDFEYVVVEFNALVLNVTGNQAGTPLANRMTILADTNNDGTAGYIDVVNDTNGDGTGAGEATIAANDPNNNATGTPALSAPLTLNVVEPAVTVNKSVVSPTPAAGDPGDTITFEIVLSNATGPNSATAFDVVLSDVVPTSFENVTFVAGSLTSTGTVTGLPSSPTIAGNSISLSADSLAPGATVTFRVTATINDNGASAPAPGSTITNTANVTFTSLPGASGTGGAWTGTAATSSTVPGAAGTSTGERTGADGEGGALNDYADSDPADVTLNSHQVGGLVYYDANNNGVRDAGETLITDSTTFRLTGTDVAGNAVSVDVTTTTGAYNFTGLRAGTYTITQLDQPVGFLDGRDTAGTSSPGTQFGGTGTGATDDRGTPTTPARDADAITAFTITGGPDSKTGINYNFGELLPAQLGNLVFLDSNGDGRQSGGAEVGIDGVSVSLSGTDDTGRAVSLSTTTATGGLYQFENLRPGSYAVTFGNSDGTVTYTRTARDVGTNDAIDSDGDPATGTTGAYTIAAGDSNQTVDQGLFVPVSLGDRVYFDFDADGVQDAGEPGIPGASIEVVWLGPDGALGGGDDQTFTTTTGANGIWTVSNLPPGSYRVTSTLPAAFTLTDSLDNGGAASAVNPVTVSTTSGADRTDIDFGYRGNASLGDRVYIDQDGDGVQDANEVGLPGVTVTLRFDANGDGDFTDAEDGLFTTVTGLNGAYQFTNLIPGAYQVSVPSAGTGGVPDNAVLTDSVDNGALSANGSPTLTLAAGENNPTIDFGFRGNSSVGDRVWIDQNRDGIQQANEPGIPGATVELRWAGADGALDTGDDVLFTTVTGTNGIYLFDGLLIYGNSDLFRATVTALPIAGLTPTADLDSPAPNGNGTAEFDVFGIPDPVFQNRRDVDFGYDGLGSLSGTVYHDLNNDGIVQGNEPRIAGVVLTLTGVDLFGNPVLDPATGAPYTATTDANGNYTFTTVIPGTYTITEAQPANYNDGIDTSGTLGGNPAVNDRISGIVVGPSQSGTQYNFGERATFLSGTVYRDDNRDGALQTGEPPLAGVVLELFAADGTTPILNPATGAPYTATTDANGFYIFDDILPGSYVVRETQPTGFADSPVGPGITINATVPLTGLPNQNFGEVLGSLAGTVYVDANTNGSLDTGEAGISGVAVTLTGTDANGNPVNRTALTDANGNYRFDNLLSGTYTVSEAQPAPFADGQETVGSVGGDATTNDVISGAVLPAGTNATNYNFGEIRPANPFLSGTVYLDADRDGTLDTNESGIGGVTVSLVDPGADGLFGTFDDTTITTTTDANGNYRFENLTAGRQYQLIESQPAIYGSSTPNTIAVPPLPSAGLTGQNFGETLGRISGSVYYDANTNGTRTAGEPGIAGVTVTLTGTDANGNPVSRTTTTDANGNYSFDALPAGTYTVTEPTQPAGYADGLEALGTAGGSAGNDTFTAIPLSGGASATNYDFGEIGVPVSGTVFLDRDRDGALDGGETGIPGVTIQLIDANGTVVRTTTTDANGNYTFPNVPPGNYTIRELQPTGYGNPPAGAFAPDTRPITVAGTAVTNQNFGDTLSTLAGTVYVDTNNDGTQQGGEAGIPNVPVALDFAGADNVFGTADDVLNFATTSTNANGEYLFTDLFSGVYRVRETTQPAPYGDGIDSPGSAGGDASTNDQITAIPVGAGTDLTEYNFGELPAANPFIAGNVYFDANDNGVRDGNEVGIADVVVTLNGPAGPIQITTDANGNYLFDNLTTGANYTITESQPTGYANGQENAGNVISVTNLPAAGSTNNNFGELLGTISGTVYFDRDAGGALDGADALLPGVTVTLTGTDANNNPVTRTTTTDANGNYSFTGLLSGNYTVTETQPAQFNQGTNTPGAFGTLGGTDQITVALPAGGASPANNFGEVGAPISGRVFLDPNRDGVPQAGETTGLGGVLITLLDANGAVVATRMTAGDGTYSFTNLPPGNYTLVQTQPNTHLSTSANVIPVTLTAAGVVNQDFGEALGSLAGSVYRDVNNNGLRDGTEAGISNVTVTLTGTDANGNPVNRTTTTDANGNYLFSDLFAGEYTVTETQPDAFDDGQEQIGTAGGNALTNDQFQRVALAAGFNATTYNFGELTSSLSGFVYRDFDLSGDRNLTGANPDTGIAGITVTLTGTDDDGRAVTATTTTGADGSYRFDGLGSGNYTITETQPPLPTSLTNGFYDGADNLGSLDGTNGTKNQFAVALGTGENGINYNFGELPPADPFGFVYVDLNRNGLRDAGEPGISGVAITISGTAFAGTIFARPITGADVPGGSLTVLTDANGRWEFNPIPPGLYSINEAQPAGYADGLESDGDPNGPPATVGNDVFTNILLNPFPIRGPFNFGEILPEVSVPPVTPPLTADQINKSMFLGSTPGQVMNMPVGPQFTNSVARLGVQSPVRSIGVAVGSGAGVGAQAQLYDFRTGALRVSFSFPSFTGGVRAAAGDVTGDGIDDLVVSFGAGADPIVAVFDGATGGLTRAFLAFPNFYKGGVNVAVGDVNNDGFADIVVTPEVGVISLVRVFDGRTSAQTAEFLAFPSFYTGGARIAVGDITGDGFADIVAGTATQAGFVAAYSGRDFSQILLGPAFGGAPMPGVNVAVGDTDGDGIGEILTTVGGGGTSFLETRQIAGANARTAITNLGVPAPVGPGLRIATADINGDSAADLVMAGTDTTRVRIVSGRTGVLLDDFFAFDPFMPTGVFVG